LPTIEDKGANLPRKIEIY